MGCNIHLWVEIREADDAPWQAVPVPKGHDTFAEELGHEPEWYPWRTLTTFAVLADVCNYNGTVPMDAPRGVPDDASASYLAEAEDASHYAYAHSWHTLRQLQEYDWPEGTCFEQELMPKLAAMGERFSIDNVRIVFFFDN